LVGRGLTQKKATILVAFFVPVAEIKFYFPVDFSEGVTGGALATTLWLSVTQVKAIANFHKSRTSPHKSI